MSCWKKICKFIKKIVKPIFEVVKAIAKVVTSWFRIFHEEEIEEPVVTFMEKKHEFVSTLNNQELGGKALAVRKEIHELGKHEKLLTTKLDPEDKKRLDEMDLE